MKGHAVTGVTRTVMLKVHLWLSFAVGAVFVVAAGTGAILAFDYEIDAYLNRNATYPVTEGEVGFEAAAEVLRDAYSAHQLELLWFPRWDKPYYEGMLIDAEGERVYQVVDPGSGALLEPVEETSAFIDVVHNLHVALLGGTVGWWIVVISTALSIVILVTGVFLWWPKLRRFFKAFTIRRRTNYLFNYDLHQVSGILALPLLLLMCVTGVFLAFPNVGNAVVHAAFLQGPSDLEGWSAVEQPPPPDDWSDADRLPPEYFLEKAHAEVPGAETFYITYPLEADEVVHVRLQTGIEPKPFGITSRLAFDQYTGELLQVIDPRRMALPDRIHTVWVDRLHFGDFAGATSKALYLLACLTGVFSTITGFIIWWMKRQRRKSGKKAVHPVASRNGGDGPPAARPRPMAAELPYSESG